MALSTPSPVQATLRRMMTFNLAGSVILLDQGLQFYARSRVDVFEAEFVTPWLAFIWQTVTPGQQLSRGVWLVWIALAVVITLAMVRLVQRRGGTFTRLQTIAFGLLLGGTATRFIDLAHWGHAVRYLWLEVAVPGFSGPLSIGTMAQWLGLITLALYVFRQRRRPAA